VGTYVFPVQRNSGHKQGEMDPHLSSTNPGVCHNAGEGEIVTQPRLEEISHATSFVKAAPPLFYYAPLNIFFYF